MAHGLAHEGSAIEEHEAESLEKTGTRSDAALTILALFLIAIAGAVLWLVFAGTGSPRVLFDGQVATYAGPDSVEVGAVTFRFVNESAKDGAFLVSRITDDTLKLADLEAYAMDAEATTVPPWVGTFKNNVIPAGETGVREMMLEEGRWWLTVHTAPDDTNEIISAGMLLEVKAK